MDKSNNNISLFELYENKHSYSINNYGDNNWKSILNGIKTWFNDSIENIYNNMKEYIKVLKEILVKKYDFKDEVIDDIMFILDSGLNRELEIKNYKWEFRGYELEWELVGDQSGLEEGSLMATPMDQFEIYSLFGDWFILKNIPIYIFTNMSVYIILILSLVLIYYLNGNFKEKIKINGWSISNEAIYFTIYNMVLGQIGLIVGLYFFNLIFVIFIYILFSNLLGLVPYNFAVTAHLVITLSMSSSVWLGVTIMGLSLHAWKYFTLFCPDGTPLVLVPLLALIELISYIAKGLSLGIRLGANLISGHLLLSILSGFGFMSLKSIWVLSIILFSLFLSLITAISGLELGIAGIQSYVFSILSSSYTNEAVYLH